MILTEYTVMLFCVGVPFTVGAQHTAAPSPLATALAVTMPTHGITSIAPDTLATSMLFGSSTVCGLTVYIFGFPVMAMVTTPSLIRTAGAWFKPGGKLPTVKFAGMIDEA